MTDSKPLIDQLRARRGEILEIAASNGAQNVHVFGSVARGEENPRSDVDFLVKFESGRSLLDMSGLQLELEELLGRQVQVVQIPSTISGARQRIAERILSEAVPL